MKKVKLKKEVCPRKIVEDYLHWSVVRVLKHSWRLLKVNEYYLLGVGVGTIVVCSSVLAYVKKLKRMLRKHVLRYERMQKYLEKE